MFNVGCCNAQHKTVALLTVCPLNITGMEGGFKNSLSGYGAHVCVQNEAQFMLADIAVFLKMVVRVVK